MHYNIIPQLLGLLLAYWGAFGFRACYKILSTWNKAKGIVEHIRAEGDGDSSWFLMEIKFTDDNGEEWLASGKQRHSLTTRVGDIKNLYYDPKNPKDIQIDEGWLIFLDSIIIFLFGVLCLLSPWWQNN